MQKQKVVLFSVNSEDTSETLIYFFDIFLVDKFLQKAVESILTGGEDGAFGSFDAYTGSITTSRQAWADAIENVEESSLPQLIEGWVEIYLAN